MVHGLALVCFTAGSMAALVVLGSTFAAGEDDAAALARPLPTNGAFSHVEANDAPPIVLAGPRHKDAKVSVPEMEAAIERLFDQNVAQSQFRNEYGVSTATAEALWEYRLAAGKALKKAGLVPLCPAATAIAGTRMRADVFKNSSAPGGSAGNFPWHRRALAGAVVDV
jgi:hypothetical protein